MSDIEKMSFKVELSPTEYSEEHPLLSNENEITDFENFNQGEIMLHSIVTPHRDIEDIAKRLSALPPNRSARGLIVAKHDDHLHVVHGCRFAGRRCRCLRGGLYVGTLRSQRARTKIPTEHLFRLCKHLVQGPGDRKLVFWQNDLSENFYRCRDPLPDSERTEEDGLYDEFKCGPLRKAGDGSVGADHGIDRKRKFNDATAAKTCWEYASEVWNFDFGRLIVNPSFVNDEELYEYWAKRKDQIQKIFENYRLKQLGEMTYWELKDFREHCEGKSYGQKFDHFMSVQDSFVILRNFWFDNFDMPIEKLNQFFDWLNGKGGKKNSWIFVGPPSCGKTLVFDSLQYIFQFYGRIRNYIKGDVFSFAEAENKLLVYLDEMCLPADGETYINQMKEIMGGYSGSLRALYKTNAMSFCPKFIGLANKDPFRFVDQVNKKAFEERMTYLTVHKVLDVEEIKDKRGIELKKIHPDAWFKLYDYVQVCNQRQRECEA